MTCSVYKGGTDDASPGMSEAVVRFVVMCIVVQLTCEGKRCLSSSSFRRLLSRAQGLSPSESPAIMHTWRGRPYSGTGVELLAEKKRLLLLLPV